MSRNRHSEEGSSEAPYYLETAVPQLYKTYYAGPYLSGFQQQIDPLDGDACFFRLKRHNDSMTEYQYTVLFEPAPEGGYNVVVPAIPEICTFGETIDKARAMAMDAIRCFLESAKETGETIPVDVTPASERFAVAV